MKRITRWSPDTCDCVIDYEWDDSVVEADRTHALKTIVSSCVFHRSQPAADNFTTVLSENAAKNELYGLLIEKLPALVESKVDEEGNTVKTLKTGVKYDFEYDADRKLQVTISGATSLEKTTLQSEADKVLGSDKVVIG